MSTSDIVVLSFEEVYSPFVIFTLTFWGTLCGVSKPKKVMFNYVLG